MRLQALDSKGRNIGPLWTGKQIFSLILPNVNLRRNSKRYKAPTAANRDEDENITIADTAVLVERGELLTGILDKNTLGASNGSMIHVIQVRFLWVCCGISLI